MKGGDGNTKEIPIFKTQTIPVLNKDPNDPSFTAAQKQMLFPQQKQQGPQPSLEVKVYEPQKPKPLVTPPQQYFQPTMTYPMGPPYPFQMGTYAPPANVVNQLVIGDQNPYQNHRTINMVYEDALPMKQLPSSMSTIGERLSINNYLRSVFLKDKDGDIIPFRNGTNNLLDRIKTTDLNPYHYDSPQLKSNPYKSLPKNMLLYRSCYPIKKTGDTIGCARDAIGMNLRLYRLTQREMMINKDQDSEFYMSEVWREIMYYEYVRENIIKKKQCPNFVIMFGYSLCNDSEIDFETVERIKNGVTLPQQNKLVRPTSMTQQTITQTTGIQVPFIMGQKTPIIQQTIIKNNPDAYNNDILTAMTESPTFNILQWASQTYANIGTTKKLINVGYYNENIWMSIIFQIMAGMYTLQKHHIHINNFSIKDNIYIKDLSGISPLTNYWKYIIDGITYYVPNYGYMVMIDTKFKDIVPTGITLGTKKQVEHKIIGNIFGDKILLPEHEIDEKIFEAFVNVLNPNNFDKTFADLGGIKPPPEIITFLTTLNTQSSKDLATAIAFGAKQQYDEKVKQLSLGKYFKVNMFRFMHNRIGTYLTKLEIDNIIKSSKNFHRGDIVVYEENSDSYQFVLIIGIRDGNAIIITRSDNSQKDGIYKQVPIGNLFSYSKSQPIKQDYKPNEAKLDEGDLLETYNLTF